MELPVGTGMRLRDGLGAIVPAVLAAVFGVVVALGAIVVVLAGGGDRLHRDANDYAADLPPAPTDNSHKPERSTREHGDGAR